MARSVELLDSEVRSLAEELKKLNAQLKDTVTIVTKGQAAFDKTAKSQGDLKTKSQQYTAVQKELIKLDKQMVRAEAQLTNEYKQVQKALIKKQAAVKKNTDAMKKQAGVLKGNRRLFQAMTKSILAAGAAYLGISQAIRAIKGVFKVINDFSKAQSNLAAILGKSKKEIKDLTSDAKRYGSQTAFTASQVTDLQTSLAKLGFTQTEVKLSTKAILDLAAATNTELGNAATVTGAALRAFNLSAAETERVSSVLAVATTKSALSFSDYEAALSTVAPVARTFGFEIEDTVALLGKLRDAGFDASKSSTALRNILLGLADSNGALAKRLGGSIKNFDELIPALVKLRGEGVDLNETLQLTDKRSVAAFNQFLVGAESASELRDSLIDVKDEMQDMVDTQLNNLTGDITKLKSAWEGLILSIEQGDGVMSKSLRRFTQGVTRGLGIFQNIPNVIGRASKMSQDEISAYTDFTTKLLIDRGGKIGKALEKELDFISKASKEKLDEFAKGLETQNIAEKSKLMFKELIRRRQEELNLELQAQKEAEEKRLDIIEASAIREARIRKKGFEALEKAEAATQKAINKIFTEDDSDLDEFLNKELKSIQAFFNEIPDNARETSEELKSIGKAFADAIERQQQELRDNISDTLSFVSELSSTFGELRSDLIESDIANIERRRDQEVAAAEEAGRDTAVIEEKFAKKEASLRTKQAKADKRQAIFQTLIATARAIAQALPNIPLSVFAGILGGAQLVKIAATPIPKFRHGTKDAPGGPATVSEGGSELGVTPDGQAFFTPKEESTMFIPKGTQIFPAYSEETKAAKDGAIDNSLLGQIIVEQQLTRKAISSQPKHVQKWSERGLEAWREHNNLKQRLLDKRFR